mgnify:CR=1 FL=1
MINLIFNIMPFTNTENKNEKNEVLHLDKVRHGP